MYCEVCGKENSQFVAICSYCGGKLVEVKPLNPEPAYKKLENSIEKKKNELNNLEIDLNKEIPTYGPGEYYRSASGEREYYRPKLKHFVDLYETKTKTIGNIVFVLMIIMMIFFFVGIFFVSSEDKNEQSIGIPFMVIVGVLFVVISVFFILFGGNKHKNESREAALTLRTGKIVKGKIKKKYKIEKKNETYYYVVFRYNHGKTLEETTQRIKKNLYSQLFEGDNIDITLGLLGVINEDPQSVEEILSRFVKKRKRKIKRG